MLRLDATGRPPRLPGAPRTAVARGVAAQIVGTRTAQARANVPAAAPARMEWADVAKAISIIGVVLLHAILAVPGGEDTMWRTFYLVLDPIRMPLFFLVSGMFAHRVLGRTLADLWFRRLWFLLVPYLAFKTITAVLRYLQNPDYQTFAQFIRSVIVGDPGIWFLYALMVFNIAAAATRKLPPAVVVALSVLPGIAYAAFDGWRFERYAEISHLVLYLPAFMIGLHGRALWLKLADLAAADGRRGGAGGVGKLMPVFVALGALGAYLTWWLLHALSGSVAGDVLVRMSGAVLAVPIALVAAVHLARVPVLSTALAAIGRNTLPIYVAHPIALWAVGTPLAGRLVDNGITTFTEPAAAVVLMLLVSVAAGVAMYFVGRTPVLKWILHPPALRRRAAGSASP